MIISTASGERKQTYDILVLATGSRTKGDVPWKSSLAGYEATKDGLHKMQAQVKAAKSIVVGGAGECDHFLWSIHEEKSKAQLISWLAASSARSNLAGTVAMDLLPKLESQVSYISPNRGNKY
jgi:hypothetical protein